VDDAANDHGFFDDEAHDSSVLRSDMERPRRIVHKVLAGVVFAGLIIGGWFALTPTPDPDEHRDSIGSSQSIRQTSHGAVAVLSMAPETAQPLPAEHLRVDDGRVKLVSSSSSSGPSWYPLWIDEEPAVVVTVDSSMPWCIVASLVDVDRFPQRVGATGSACTEQGVRPGAQCSGELVLAILTEAPEISGTKQPWAWRLRADIGLSSYRTELPHEAGLFAEAPRFRTDDAQIVELTVGQLSTTCRRS